VFSALKVEENTDTATVASHQNVLFATGTSAHQTAVAAAVPAGTHVHGSMYVHMSVREEKIRHTF